MRITQAAAVAALAIAAASVGAGPADASPGQWGAISVSQVNGTTDAVWNYPSEKAAIDAANAGCDAQIKTDPLSIITGSSMPVHDCAWKVTFPVGECGAVAQASNGLWSWAYAEDLARAKARAIAANNGPRPVVINSACQN